MLKKSIKLLFIFIVLFFCVFSFVSAKTISGKPNIKMVEKKFVDGKTSYAFKIGDYNPMIIVKFLNKEAADYSTPEKALITHLSAMQALDYKWFRNSWDKKSLAYMDKLDKRAKRTDLDMLVAWKKLKNRPHFLNLKAEIKYEGRNYVLVGWTADMGKERGPFEFVPMYKKGNRWYLSQDLREHPVYLYITDIAGCDEKVININKFKDKKKEK